MKTLFHSISYARFIKTLPFAIVSFILLSCSNKYEDAIVRRVERFLEDNLSQYDEVVIIPGAGCTGCISNAESFFLNNVSNDRILFVFTYFISQKSLYMRLGQENLARDNVLIDTDDRFYVSHYHDNIYPYIIKVDDGHVVDARLL